MRNALRTFTEREKSILKIIQKNLPDSLTPFADIAKIVGCSEKEVLQLLQSMKEEGYIRRFGASLKHQNAGYKNNVMVAWKVTTDTVDSAGNAMAKHPMISHCYYRPSQISDWPFELYTMIHGRSLEECEEVIADCIEVSGLTEYTVLKSIKELKKTSMTYF